MRRNHHWIITLAYRILLPIIDPLKFFYAALGYFRFVKILLIFNFKYPGKINLKNLFPITDEKTKYTSFDHHYFYQQLWAFEKIVKSNTKHHYDIGSTYQMSGYISKFCKVTFIDIRPIKATLKNLDIVAASLLHLPYQNDSLSSVSCLHVIEHVGLGRYDDYLDIEGPEKSAQEIQRVLSKNGKLYLSTPIGIPDIYFNAHRVFHPLEVLNLFPKLNLLSFSVVTDNGEYIEDTDPAKYTGSKYACGMYEFAKK